VKKVSIMSLLCAFSVSHLIFTHDLTNTSIFAHNELYVKISQARQIVSLILALGGVTE